MESPRSRFRRAWADLDCAGRDVLCNTDLRRPRAAVKRLCDVWVYFDVVQVWLPRPLSRKELRWVNGQVAYPILGYPFLIQQGGRQRLILKRPSEACLRFFAERSATVNFVEFALDIITPFAFELKREVSVGFVQRWHGTKQVTVFPNGNFRTGDLGRPGLTFQAYDDKPSRKSPARSTASTSKGR